MRIRSIKPEFWRSPDITELAIEDRLLFIGLWSYVDDNGVGLDRLSSIAADLFAGDLERNAPETFARVSRGLARLSDAGRIIRYTVKNGAVGDYIEIVNWSKHQRIDKPGKARYPRSDAESAKIRDTLPTSRDFPAPGTGEQGNRGTGEQGNSSSSSEVADATTRPEITHLLDLLDTEIIRNGGKAPARTKRNLDAARLLLDRDGYTVEQVERAIRWCQADEFWRSNILSMSKLREKYEQLRLAAQRRPQSEKQSKDQRALAVLEIGARLQAEDDRKVIA